MGTALNTFGVDADEVRADFPHFRFDADDALTPTRLTKLINRASARVCAWFIRAGLTPSEITASAHPVDYYRAQSYIIACVAPHIMLAVAPRETELIKLLFEQKKQEEVDFLKDSTVLGDKGEEAADVASSEDNKTARFDEETTNVRLSLDPSFRMKGNHRFNTGGGSKW